MTAREYIETIAQELSKARGRGLLLSPADAQLALQWHAAQVPLQAVLTQVRRDQYGTIIAEPEDTSIEELLQELRCEVTRSEAQLDTP